MAATTYDVRGRRARARGGLSRPRRRVEAAAGGAARDLLRDGRSAQPRDRPGALGRGLHRRVPPPGRAAPVECGQPPRDAAAAPLRGRLGWVAPRRPGGGTALSASAIGYGFGLFVEHHSDHGHVVHHPGGYPGYGSHMRWHPETGLGVVALANGTYAGPVETARNALRALVSGERAAAVAPVVTPALVDAVTARIASHGQPYADDLFSFNVALDVPETVRLAQLAAARDLVGAPTGPATAPRSQGLGSASWSIPAERGRLDVEVKVAPTTPQPAVQSLKVTAVPDAPESLLLAATQALGGASRAPATPAPACSSVRSRRRTPWVASPRSSAYWPATGRAPRPSPYVPGRPGGGSRSPMTRRPRSPPARRTSTRCSGTGSANNPEPPRIGAARTCGNLRT